MLTKYSYSYASFMMFIIQLGINAASAITFSLLSSCSNSLIPCLCCPYGNRHLCDYK